MESGQPFVDAAAGSRVVLTKGKSVFLKNKYSNRRGRKEKYFYVYIHIQLPDILVSQHCIVLAENIVDVKGYIYTDNYSLRVMRALPVGEVYKDFHPSKQVFKDLLADGRAMKKRLNGLAKTAGLTFFTKQE